MHIAICDDNIADRKHLERLLKRESDKRLATSGNLYADSFGDSALLAKNPMQYDLFFLDMPSEENDALTFALSLIEAGVRAPIILCSSTVDYGKKIEALPSCPSNLFHRQKELKSAELSAIVDIALEYRAKKEPRIELRADTNTYYVLEDDIAYAVMDGEYLHVHLSDGRIIVLFNDVFNFYEQVSMFTHMVMLNNNALINIVYMKDYTTFKVTMQDGTELKSSLFAKKYIKSALQMYHAETLS